MCGIFGFVAGAGAEIESSALKNLLVSLFKLSESRGREASGVCLRTGDAIHLLKSPVAASALVQTEDFHRTLEALSNRASGHSIAAIGHSRLVTNGSGSFNDNNQPVSRDGLVGVHNGIIVNDAALWKELGLTPRAELDSEVILALVARELGKGSEISTAVGAAFARLEGAATVALLPTGLPSLMLATNTGSLYVQYSRQLSLFVFASESFILKQLAEEFALMKDPTFSAVSQVRPGTGLVVALGDSSAVPFSFNQDLKPVRAIPSEAPRARIQDHSNADRPDPRALRRCTRCVLPETFPFIDFDAAGVCVYCRNHVSFKAKGEAALRKMVEPYRRSDGGADCLMGVSGGRDSCYGLHYVKTVLGMNPIAFTYDWGMVTDLARRNAARMCGKLGIEHILVSADIAKKRANVRMNIRAWMKKPDLGVIPLFMAGDKQFFWYAHELRKQTGVPLFLFGAGNDFERTDFKTGFCGVREGGNTGVVTKLASLNKFKLAAYYAKQFVLNPAYLNPSVFDTVHAFYSTYILRDDYLYLYHYLRWDEEVVNRTLIDGYGWETSPDTESTWRIGDGTAAFYNYVYYQVAGLTEHDTFRSNQIREGVITREKGLERVIIDNQPRWETLNWYAKTIGFNLDEALTAINRIPRHYALGRSPAVESAAQARSA
jgi:glucosamine--fructose-6-phosphate aminotransferase (isomerizing)